MPGMPTLTRASLAVVDEPALLLQHISGLALSPCSSTSCPHSLGGGRGGRQCRRLHDHSLTGESSRAALTSGGFATLFEYLTVSAAAAAAAGARATVPVIPPFVVKACQEEAKRAAKTVSLLAVPASSVSASPQQMQFTHPEVTA